MALDEISDTASPKMSLGELPNELLTRIFHYAHEPEDEKAIENLTSTWNPGAAGVKLQTKTICNISRVSSHFNAIAEPVLYSALLGGPRSSTLRLMSSLLDKPQRLTYVRVLAVYDCPDWRLPAVVASEPLYAQDFRVQHRSTIAKAVSRIYSDLALRVEWLKRLQYGHLAALNSLLLLLLPNLRQLSLRCLSEQPFDIISIVPKMLELGQHTLTSDLGLQQLSNVALCFEDDDLDEQYPIRRFPHSFLRFPRLSSLQVRSLTGETVFLEIDGLELGHPKPSKGQPSSLTLSSISVRPEELGPFLQQFKGLKVLEYVEGSVDDGGHLPYPCFSAKVVRDAIEHLAPTLESLTLGTEEASEPDDEKPVAVQSLANFTQLKHLNVPGEFLNGKSWWNELDSPLISANSTPAEALSRVVNAVPVSLESLTITACNSSHVAELLELLWMKKDKVPRLKNIEIKTSCEIAYGEDISSIEADGAIRMLEIASKLAGVAMVVHRQP